MTGPANNEQQVLVVTLRSLNSGALESSPLESAADPKRQALMDRYLRVIAKMEAETAKSGGNVMITLQDRDASMLQSKLAEFGIAGEPLSAGGLEAKFGEGPFGGDIIGWALSLLDRIDPSEAHPIVRPPDDHVGAIADTGRVAVISDWGTNLYGAPKSAASIQSVGGYELLLHLGDVYYSGTSAEVKERFLEPWPTSAGKISRALNGNHEMYSGGFAYFDDILPAFKQPSSYFAVQNKHWLLIALDTAHTDQSIDDMQAKWLNDVVHQADGRKVILFSHHQPFSRLGNQGPDLQAALAGLLQQKAITAWYWGHEHDCVIYDRHPPWGMLGRCIGHGGIPSPRKPEVMTAPTARSLNGVSWKRFVANEDTPGCIILDGPNPLVPGEEEKFGPHGYLTLDFDGPNLVERIHLPDSTEIYKATV